MTVIVRPPRERRMWDLILACVLLAVYLGLTVIMSLSGLFLGFTFGACETAPDCNSDLRAFGTLFALVGVWVPVLFVIGGTIFLLVTRRIAFWVPILGIALTIGIYSIGAAMVQSALGN